MKKKKEKIKKIYLSYGAGVGSEALRLWLLKNNFEFEAVYVDHGCDWPETQEFVKIVPDLIILKPDVRGFDNLYDYCLHYKMVPSFMRRWCTEEFKINTLYNYFKRPCIVYIGFTWDESHRLANSTDPEIFNQFPFVCLKWSRDDCVKYIRSLGLIVPVRSNCWFCPYQGKERWPILRERHPDLYQKAKKLEKLNMEYRKSKGKIPQTLHASGKSLEVLTKEGQLNLFNDEQGN